MYMTCSFVKAHKAVVQKLVGAFVKTLRYIGSHTGAQIAKQMPADYASGSGGVSGYAASINSTKQMFNTTGMMDASAAKNALAVLRQFNPDVKAHADSVDLSETYTTQFVTQVPGS
jgi:NitT/TauT family transport system substrate-binding protein